RHRARRDHQLVAYPGGGAHRHRQRRPARGDSPGHCDDPRPALMTSPPQQPRQTGVSSARVEWQGELATALTAGTFVKLTLGKPKRGKDDVAGPKQAFVRCVDIRHAPHISILLRYPNKDVTQNHPIAAAATAIGEYLDDSFDNAHLFTTRC